MCQILGIYEWASRECVGNLKIFQFSYEAETNETTQLHGKNKTVVCTMKIVGLTGLL